MTVFQTPAPIDIITEIGLGTVTVVAAERGDTVVEIRPADAGKKDDVKAAGQLKVDFSDGTLTVNMPKGWRVIGPSGKGAVEVIIEAPVGSRLNGNLAHGTFRTAGDLGESSVEVAAGEILVGRAVAAVTAKTAQGDITIGEAVRGVLRLETSVGDLRVGIHPGSAARVQSNTSRGAVNNQLGPVDPSNDDLVEVYAHTASGNVVIGHATTV
ncbi:hypothetical protein D7D52_10400 [Nocardia yunnanensis]|uniref:Adhesin domain-containing protein n=1 Tax=Nocardia yunnanensis TaxID=2382165 RepID=A0A386ZC58_9NOCA|nr:hypothetical protein [Nocardia yunnanensis]AYF74205.1 hypothetical protein D7D52_10400 [Nocardia yunnanensis]